MVAARCLVVVVAVMAGCVLIDGAQGAEWWQDILNGAARIGVERLAEFLEKGGKAAADNLRTLEQQGPLSRNKRQALNNGMNQFRHICPTVVVSPLGVNHSVLKSAFGRSDENNDGTLDTKELSFFEDIMNAYQMCVLLERGMGK